MDRYVSNVLLEILHDKVKVTLVYLEMHNGYNDAYRLVQFNGHTVSLHNSNSLLSTGQIVIFRWMMMMRKRMKYRRTAHRERGRVTVWRHRGWTVQPLQVAVVPHARHGYGRE